MSKGMRKSALSAIGLATALGSSMLAVSSAEAYLNVQFVPVAVNGVPVDYSTSTANQTTGSLVTGGVTVSYSAASTPATGAGGVGIPANAKNPATGLGTNLITGVVVGTVVSFNVVATITEQGGVPISTVSNYANIGNFAGIIRSSGYTASNILGTFGAVNTSGAAAAGFSYGGGALQTGSTSVAGTAANFVGASTSATVNAIAGVQQSSINYAFSPTNASSTTGSTLGWSFVMSSSTYTVTGIAGSENALQLFEGSSPNTGSARPSWFDGQASAKSYRANSADLLGVGYWTGTTFTGATFTAATALNNFMTPLVLRTATSSVPTTPAIAISRTPETGPDVIVEQNFIASGFDPGERAPLPNTTMFTVGFRPFAQSAPALNPGSVLVTLDFEINGSSPNGVDDFTALYASLLASLPGGTTGFLFNTGNGVAPKPDWVNFIEGANQSYDMLFIIPSALFTAGTGGDYKFTLSNIPANVTLRGVGAIPEPTSLALVAVPALALVRRRRA